MKALRIIVPAVLCVALFLALRSRSQSTIKTPRFVPVTSQPTGPFLSIHYDWGGAEPFQGGKVWLWTVSNSTNMHSYLYDLEKRTVIGELLNAGNTFCNRDFSKLLCQGPGAPSLTEKVAQWVKKISSGKIAIKVRSVETFWVLDLPDNSATRLGEFSQNFGTGSRWVPSPDFRYGYNVPSTSEGSSFYVCDLESRWMKKIRRGGELKGWWDARNIIVQDSANNLVLFDVATRHEKTWLSAASLEELLRREGVTNTLATIESFAQWTGRQYDLFFTAGGARHGSGDPSFLVVTDRSGPKLRLLRRNFKFHHLGRFNPELTAYIYNGEPGAPGRGGNGAVLLYDLATDSVRTLVEPDNRGRYALPRLYGNEVIYFRDGHIFRQRLDGTKSEPLLP